MLSKRLRNSEIQTSIQNKKVSLRRTKPWDFFFSISYSWGHNSYHRTRTDAHASYVPIPVFHIFSSLWTTFLQLYPKDLRLLTETQGGYRRRLPGRSSSAIAVCWGHQRTYHPSWLCPKSAVRVLHFRNHWQCNEVCMVWQGLPASAPIQTPLMGADSHFVVTWPLGQQRHHQTKHRVRNINGGKKRNGKLLDRLFIWMMCCSGWEMRRRRWDSISYHPECLAINSHGTLALSAFMNMRRGC